MADRPRSRILPGTRSFACFRICPEGETQTAGAAEEFVLSLVKTKVQTAAAGAAEQIPILSLPVGAKNGEGLCPLKGRKRGMGFIIQALVKAADGAGSFLIQRRITNETVHRHDL